MIEHFYWNQDTCLANQCTPARSVFAGLFSFTILLYFVRISMSKNDLGFPYLNVRKSVLPQFRIQGITVCSWLYWMDNWYTMWPYIAFLSVYRWIRVRMTCWYSWKLLKFTVLLDENFREVKNKSGTQYGAGRNLKRYLGNIEFFKLYIEYI